MMWRPNEIRVFKGDTPATLFVKDQVGYYDWAATHNAFRLRGFQDALH
jgi:hypothetical protein